MNDTTLSTIKDHFRFSSWSLSKKEKIRIVNSINGVYFLDSKPYLSLSEEYYDYFLEKSEPQKKEILNFLCSSQYWSASAGYESAWFNVNAPIVIERQHDEIISLEFIFKPIGNVHEWDVYTFRDLAKTVFGWYRVSTVPSSQEPYTNAVINFKAEEKTAMVLFNQYVTLTEEDISCLI